MFDDPTGLIFGAFFCILVGFIGWIIGIMGFVRANHALERLGRLEKEHAFMAGLRPARAAPEPVEPAPVAVIAAEALPTVIEETPPEPPPVLPPPAPPPLPLETKPRLDLEALITQRWGIWLGAAALLFAGVFLIRYAVDQGLLGPGMRCTLAALLGFGLIGGARWARSRSVPLAGLRDQVPPALAAGGVATLLVAAYGAGPFYGLVDPRVAFLLMGAAGLFGLVLSLREGQLVAVVGLAGAFLTPALVATETPSLPGLFVYLLVVLAAALSVVRYTAWVWLGWFSSIAAAFWVLASIGVAHFGDVWAPALFVPAAALLNLALLPEAALATLSGRRLAWIPFGLLGTVGLVLVDSVDDPLPKAGVLLLAPVAIWVGQRRTALDRLPWLAAGFYGLLLAIWSLPAVAPTGEAIRTMDRVQAILPGPFAPEAIMPYLVTGALAALFFALAGLWFERRAERPLVWAALVAAVPVIALAIAFWRVRAFRTDVEWGFAGLALMAALTATTREAMREGSRTRGGVHAAGAVSALSLALAMLLTDQFLTLSLALILPGLALIEARTEVTALRRVALIVALVVLARLLLNRFVLDYGFGRFPVVNGLIFAYAAPAALFATASFLFRRRADDLTVAVLQAGAAALATVFTVAEIHHWATGGHVADATTGLLERGLTVSALCLLALGTIIANRRVAAPVLRWAWLIQGGAGLAGGAMLLLFNPALTGGVVGTWPILNALLPAYAVPAALAVLALRLPETKLPPMPMLLASFAVIAGFAWVSLEVRHEFHPTDILHPRVTAGDAEIWAYSGVWLAYGLALMAVGISWNLPRLRLVALAVVGLTAAKAFLIDIGGIGGLWRVLSFLGLGLVLIGLGAVYRRFVAPGAADAVSPE